MKHPSSLSPNTQQLPQQLPPDPLPISGHTKLVGLMGWPVSHTFSPAMHNAAFDALNLNWRYLPLPVDPARLPDALRGLVALGFVGCNLTIPHKKAALPLLDELTPAAQMIGAVNTIKVSPNGHLLGHNTDAPGLLEDLQHHNIPITDQSALLLGAGGSARAAAVALLGAQCSHLLLSNRTPAKAHALANNLSQYFPQTHIEVVAPPSQLHHAKHIDLIINCTPAGMGNDGTSPLSSSFSFSPKQTVYDLIYTPETTPLLAHARSQGARGINGLGMLLRQGALAFTLWTRQPPPLPPMREALQRSLAKR